MIKVTENDHAALDETPANWYNICIHLIKNNGKNKNKYKNKKYISIDPSSL
jgi:hypothetical protein